VSRPHDRRSDDNGRFLAAAAPQPGRAMEYFADEMIPDVNLEAAARLGLVPMPALGKALREATGREVYCVASSSNDGDHLLIDVLERKGLEIGLADLLMSSQSRRVVVVVCLKMDAENGKSRYYELNDEASEDIRGLRSSIQ
jgi:hypothetical protein